VFCNEESRDLVCPKPLHSLPAEVEAEPEAQVQSEGRSTSKGKGCRGR